MNKTDLHCKAEENCCCKREEKSFSRNSSFLWFALFYCFCLWLSFKKFLSKPQDFLSILMLEWAPRDQPCDGDDRNCNFKSIWLRAPNNHFIARELLKLWLKNFFRSYFFSDYARELFNFSFSKQTLTANFGFFSTRVLKTTSLCFLNQRNTVWMWNLRTKCRE